MVKVNDQQSKREEVGLADLLCHPEAAAEEWYYLEVQSAGGIYGVG